MQIYRRNDRWIKSPGLVSEVRLTLSIKSTSSQRRSSTTAPAHVTGSREDAAFAGEPSTSLAERGRVTSGRGGEKAAATLGGEPLVIVRVGAPTDEPTSKIDVSSGMESTTSKCKCGPDEKPVLPDAAIG